MKPRIEKKVSKKLASILGDTFGKVWIDDELELFPHHWRHSNSGRLTPKQKRENYQERVSVNHMPCVGGEYDPYVGDASEHYTLYAAACGALMWEGAEIDDEGHVTWPDRPKRINARWCLRKAREYMETKAA